MSRLQAALAATARYESIARPTCEFARVVAVADGADPDRAHTVDVRLKDSGLDLSAVPLASGAAGMALLPRVGDLVLLLFPRGDLSSAVALTQVYSSDRRPPKFDKDEALFVFPGDAEEDEEATIRVSLSVADGRKLRLDLGGSQATSLTLSDGKLELSSGDVAVTLSESDTKLSVSVGDNSIEVADGQGVTIKAGNKLTLQASEIALEGDVKVKIRGSMVELN